jgi:hypothetical protein
MTTNTPGGVRALGTLRAADGTGIVRLEDPLTADGEQTILVIEDRGLPLEQIAAYGAGDQIHVEDLASYLAGRERCDSRVRWQELHPTYQHLAADIT